MRNFGDRSTGQSFDSEGGRLDQIAHVPVALATSRSPTLTSPAK